MYEVQLTRHSKERLHERRRMKSEEKMLHLASNAFQNGKYEEAGNKEGTFKLLYQGDIYIFSFTGTKAKLVTVYPNKKVFHKPSRFKNSMRQEVEDELCLMNDENEWEDSLCA